MPPIRYVWAVIFPSGALGTTTLDQNLARAEAINIGGLVVRWEIIADYRAPVETDKDKDDKHGGSEVEPGDDGKDSPKFS